MSRILMVLTALILMGCATGTPITDFTKRSVYYTWIDVSDIPGNNLQWFQARNLSDPENERYYGMGFEKVGDGYLIWHNGVTPGRYEFSKMALMSCLGILCTNTINEFDFGQPGTAPGKTSIGNPGVYFGGCHAFKQTKRGFFRPGEFDTRRTKCKVSKNKMLSIMLKHAPKDHPIVAQRISRAMGG